MRSRRSRSASTLLAAASCFALWAFSPASAGAASGPAWGLTMTPLPANFVPAASPQPEYLVAATNVGAASTTGASLLKVTLPVGLTPTKVLGANSDEAAVAKPTCTISSQTVECETAEAVGPGRQLTAQIFVAVSAPEGTLVSSATVSGGGAEATSTSIPTEVSTEALPFQILPGFSSPATDEEGNAEISAGSHPYQLTPYFAFPTAVIGNAVTNAGHPRDFTLDLPRGLTGNLAATQSLCTEAELTSAESCPNPTEVGLADITTIIGGQGATAIITSPIYNMVPPPGSAAELATNAANAGIYVHILGGVRSESDYGIEGSVLDSLAFGGQPIFAVHAQLWGNPSAPAHDRVRGKCLSEGGECQVPRTESSFLAMPADCPGAPLGFGLRADSWEEPGKEVPAGYESADLNGNPVSMQGCGELEFEPAIEARPSTQAADSPAGLDFTLSQAQGGPQRENAPLKDLSMTLPAGLAVNPSQAAGLGVCSETQIGLIGSSGGTPHFSKTPQSCPDAAKIGTATVASPLLVQRNEEHEVVLDGEGNPVPEPLHGALYVAKPFENPFGSLVALYAVVEDPKTGIVAKLAGEGHLDPQSGQITTIFRESPELPLAYVKAHLFNGDRAPLTTPPTCGSHTTTSDLTPWSAPQGEDAHPQDAFQISEGAGGGACPQSEAQMPNSPNLVAGTTSPQAGTYSPLHLRLSRADGSQRWQRLEASLPLGLSAKLAGVGECSDAQIALAYSREAPNMGALEQASPSCPASSEIGTILGSAGSGPHPYYTTGHAYLAGPYKGAPLSVVAIVPAVAGPFDLGTVVARSALYLDPTTARGRVVSDPFPAVLDGVPVDLRSLAISVDRPGFTLNPTSCDPKAFEGSLVSTLGQVAPLGQRFQVGGCSSLPYGPKLSARLTGPTHRGAHPRLRVVLTAKPGEANTAALSFTLPRSEFIDQAHFRTICTRVQFAANQCPAGSVYGWVKAWSPLVEYPLEGPIYLRSSVHKLPDAVAALRGPASQPIEIDAVSRVDSVKGRLRNRVETVPDAPIEKVIVTLQGAKKGLFQNSTDVCRGKHDISASFTAQNGKTRDISTPLSAKCGGKGKGSKR